MAINQELANAYRERLLLPQRAAIAERLTAAVRAGQLRSDLDSDFAIDLLLGPIQSRWSLGLAGLTDSYADATVEAVLAHLGP
ncbi:TetR-like C-terminal domain-containing protein [Nocardia sp. NPDC050630]|uniref:TetR-like C-terminal domain-containing protein n=1 Tax=Nocardia sp. NPDC050630 TaxID=3364321 RepID=UPI00379804F9